VVKEEAKVLVRGQSQVEVQNEHQLGVGDAVNSFAELLEQAAELQSPEADLSTDERVERAKPLLLLLGQLLRPAVLVRQQPRAELKK